MRRTVLTFEGRRTTHGKVSRKARGMDSMDPKGPSSNFCAKMAQKMEEPKFGAWVMGHKWERVAGEDLGRRWHGGRASWVLGTTELGKNKYG